MGLLMIGIATFAVVGLMAPFWLRSPTTGRSFLSMYANQAYPMFVRNGPALAPLYSVAWVVIAVAVIAPPSIGPWISILWFAIVELAVVLSYRVPAPFLPRWMLEEISAGRVEVARPDRQDRSLLRWFLIMVTAAELAIPIVILGGGVHR